MVLAFRDLRKDAGVVDQDIKLAERFDGLRRALLGSGSSGRVMPWLVCGHFVAGLREDSRHGCKRTNFGRAGGQPRP